MNNFDKYITDHLKEDGKKYKPGLYILPPLMNYLNDKKINSKVFKNSLIDPLLSVFTTKLTAIKIGIVALVVLGFFNIKQIQQNRNYTIHCDTASVYHQIDTLHNNIYLSDSLSR